MRRKLEGKNKKISNRPIKISIVGLSSKKRVVELDFGQKLAIFQHYFIISKPP